jgi:protein-export membrane protein SecD/preprotein translocase SecF subunit
MKSLSWRLALILALAALSIFFLVPRNVSQRTYDPATGRMRDTTVRRVPINLGLDLRGGIHLALEVDESRGHVANCADAIRRAEHVVRSRIDEFGTSEPVVQVVGDCRLIVELPGINDPARAKDIVQRTAFLEFRLGDSQDAFRRALPAMDAALRRAGVTDSGASARRRDVLSGLLQTDSSQAEAAPKAGADAPLSSLLEAGGIPGEVLVREDRVATVERLLALPEVQRFVPRGFELRWGAPSITVGRDSYRPLYAVSSRPIITGEELRDAQAGRDPMTNSVEVQFQLTQVGGKRFAEATSRNIGNHLAILLDGRVQGQPSVIQTRIETSGRITMGGKPLQEASDLALVLRAGSLPTPLHVVDERALGPSLGQDSIRDGVRASILAVGFVLVVMGVYYGLAGLLAVSALFFYVLYSLGGLAVFGFTLSLPGLAGFALSIGMAVDGNVLIFERMREELDAGKPVRTAVNEGFKHAMSAIVDSNVTTALTALILYAVGTQAVQGFAITLLIGLAASMLSAIFVTRTLFLVWVKRRPQMTRLAASFPLRLYKNARYDFIGMRRWAYAVTAAIILPGLILLAARRPTYSIEFTGGTLVQLRTAAAVGTDGLRSALHGGPLGTPEIQSFGSDRDYVVRARLENRPGGQAETEAVVAAVRGALDTALGRQQYEIVRRETVSPKVGGELRTKALIAILFSFVTTLIYLGFRFEWRFGLAAVIATAHDVLATVAFITYMDLEVSLVVVAALLTVLGYSLNDTIVIFDRVRENLRSHRSTDFEHVLNTSINETLPRTVLTGGTTLATALVLSFFAGEVIKPFALVMTFGIVIGTFSSVFVAAPVLLWITRRWRGSTAVRARRAGDPTPVELAR